MSNNLNPRPLDGILKELEVAGFSQASCRAFRDLFIRSDKVLTNLGQIQSVTPITGRTEGIATTVQNITTVGQLASTDNIAADGTGSPLTGGRRGFQALDTNNRLSSSLNLNPVDAAAVPTSTTGLSNDGVSTTVTVPSQSIKFSFGSVAYNSGSVDPGGFGSFYVYADDPTFAGGVVAFQSTTDGSVAKAGGKGRVFFGAITTTGGAAKTGGGNTGGTTTGGSGGSRGANL